MHKLASLVLCVGLLGGCVYAGGVAPTEPPVSFEDLSPKAKLYALRGEFDLLVTQVDTYVQLPFCDTVEGQACAKRNVVVDLFQITNSIELTLDAIEDLPDITSENAAEQIAALRASLASARNLVAREAVQNER